jgi:hypothetical protein
MWGFQLCVNLPVRSIRIQGTMLFSSTLLFFKKIYRTLDYGFGSPTYHKCTHGKYRYLKVSQLKMTTNVREVSDLVSSPAAGISNSHIPWNPEKVKWVDTCRRCKYLSK